MMFVLGPCASVGVHVIKPELVFIAMPAGGEIRLNDSVFVGTSVSVAHTVTVSVASSLMFVFGGMFKTGGELTSLTVTLKELVAESGGEPLSVTTVVIVYTPGP